MSTINVKVLSESGEIRRFSSDPSFAALKSSLTTRFDEGSGLKVTYKDESDDDVCLSNDEDLQTALHITGAADGAKTLKLKVKAVKDPIETQALANLQLNEQSLPLKKQFKKAVMADPSLLALMLDPALGAQEKARGLPSAELQQWFLDNQHDATEKLAKLQRKMDCGHFGRQGGFGKGKGGGKCGKGSAWAPGFACDGKGKGKGGKGGPHGNHHMQHAVHRLQHVLSKQPEVAQQLLAEPQSLQPLSQYHRLHQFCLNHPEVLQEQLNIFRAAQASSLHAAQTANAADTTPAEQQQQQQQQQWVPMRHRIVRYLSNHDEARAALRNDSTSASIDAVMASKPGMLRFLQSSPSELPALLDEAEAAVAARAANPAASGGVKRSADEKLEKKEKKLAEQQQKKAKKLEHKQLKVRVKVVKYLTKHQKELAMLRADPSPATAATIFSSKPKLNKFLTENADAIPQFVEEAVVMSADADTTSSSSDDHDAMEDDTVVITPDMTA